MSIKLSAASGQCLGRLQRGLRVIGRPPILRLALAIGLRNCGARLPAQGDSKGPEIPLKVLSGGRDVLFDTLLVSVLSNPKIVHDPAEKRRAYKCLTDFGLQLLSEGYDSESRDNYLVSLARNHMS